MGYAWLPLLKDGRVIMNESHVSVAANLPAGYLSCQEGASKVDQSLLCLLAIFWLYRNSGFILAQQNTESRWVVRSGMFDNENSLVKDY